MGSLHPLERAVYSATVGYATYRYALLGVRFSRRFVPGVGDRPGALPGLQQVTGPSALGWADLSDAQWRAWRGNLASLLAFLVAHAALGHAVRRYAAKREREAREAETKDLGDRHLASPAAVGACAYVRASSRLRSAIGIAFATYLHGARVLVLLALLFLWHGLALRVGRAREEEAVRAGGETEPPRGAGRGGPQPPDRSIPLHRLCSRLVRSPTLLLWGAALSILIAVRLSDGGARAAATFGALVPALSAASLEGALSSARFRLLFGPQAVRWDVCFNLVLLRMLSYAFDALDDEREAARARGGAPKGVGSLDALEPAVRPQRDALPLSYSCLVAYALYPPLYATGPTIAYRHFARDALVAPADADPAPEAGSTSAPPRAKDATDDGARDEPADRLRKRLSLPLPEASGSPPQSPRIATAWAMDRGEGNGREPAAGEGRLAGGAGGRVAAFEKERAKGGDTHSEAVGDGSPSTLAAETSGALRDSSRQRPRARHLHEADRADEEADALSARPPLAPGGVSAEGASRRAAEPSTGCPLACPWPHGLSGPWPSRLFPPPSSPSPLAATARFCVDVAAAESLTRLIFANALLLSARRAWPVDWAGPRHPLDPYGWSADLVACLAWWQLGFLWLKFASVWRLARAAALWDGVRAPENLLACFAATVDVESFWRAWHASFNAWLVRYLYVPLGGRTHRLRNVCISFAFVALWHDLEWRLALWGALACAAFAPEAIAKALARTEPARRCRRRFPVLARHVTALAASINLMGLAAGNLVGFALGPTLAATMLGNVGGDPRFLARALAVVFASTQLSLERRRNKTRPGTK